VLAFRQACTLLSEPPSEIISTRHTISRECYSDQVQSSGLEVCLLSNASLEDFCCPGPAESPSRDGSSWGWFESLDHYRLGPWGPSAEKDCFEDEYFGGMEWGWDIMDLEIPEEGKQVLPESKSDSNTSSSACTTEGSTWLENQSRDKTSSTDTGQNPTLNAAI
jgi:hypothetical protein